MLTADPAELHGRGGGALAEHVAACPACRALARALANDLDALGAAVSRRWSHREHVVVTLLPIAALVVGVLTFSVHRARSRAVSAPAPAVAAVRAPGPQTVSVDVARGQHATVFKTKDPTVTVVWLSNDGGL